MPEYLAPGVYVEEVSFRSKSIEGVPTSTTGFAGMAHFGPVQYPGGPKSSSPRLITSFTEFERVYGGLGALYPSDGQIQLPPPPEPEPEPEPEAPPDPNAPPEDAGNGDPPPEPPAEPEPPAPIVPAELERLAYLAHAARAFFENGGKRLYVSRVFVPRDPNVPDDGVAKLAVDVKDDAQQDPTTAAATWRARWPGRAGNVRVVVEHVRSKNIAYVTGGTVQAQRVRAGAVVEVIPKAATSIPSGKDALAVDTLRVVAVDANGVQTFIDKSGSSAAPQPGDTIQLIELRVRVEVDRERVDVYDELGAHPDQRRYIGRILQKDDPADEDAVVWFEWDPSSWTPANNAADLRKFLPAWLVLALTSTSVKRLAGGHDGALALPTDLAGKDADPDKADVKATGLAALAEIDDIAIVALPDGGTYDGANKSVYCAQAAEALISHAERMRYRIAVVDAPQGSSLSEVRAFRGQFDSSRAALYHPWLEILDPNERPSGGSPPRLLTLPPSGFVAGVYARTDITRGVHKAPANEIIRGLVRFESNINTPRQDVLNPEGINALRAFEGRGNRVWGARTLSSDPEWKYVNVRRLFNYIEHSIDKGTQWAVFEPNNRRLWDNVRRTIEDFLLVLWKDGALLGDSPKEAYFVRCDRTTMTQNDIDNGRLVCLVGLAPVKPAEYVVFRIGQWTADAKV